VRRVLDVHIVWRGGDEEVYTFSFNLFCRENIPVYYTGITVIKKEAFPHTAPLYISSLYLPKVLRLKKNQTLMMSLARTKKTSRNAKAMDIFLIICRPAIYLFSGIIPLNHQTGVENY
jgi:hypothetical protein